MANNVRFEKELYEPMRLWLYTYLKDKYKHAEIQAIDCHARTLDVILEEAGIIEHYPHTVGLDIQIDVLGIVKTKRDVKLVFIEAKKGRLTLHDLGQILIYCRLCDPDEAFLLSSSGLGSLSKVLNNLRRFDLLAFGENNKYIKSIKVGKWDIKSNSIDFMTLVPKL